MITRDEARRIARAIGGADGGCLNCAKGLAEEMNDAGLGWRFDATKKDLFVKAPEWGDPGDRYRRVYVRIEETP